MPTQPYAPIRDNVKEVSQEQMQAILDKHAKPKKLKWTRESKYAQVAEGYSVAAIVIRGHYSFEAWRVGKPWVRLGSFPAAQAARDECEADAAKVAA